jgi:hypothetical protein
MNQLDRTNRFIIVFVNGFVFLVYTYVLAVQGEGLKRFADFYWYCCFIFVQICVIISLLLKEK